MGRNRLKRGRDRKRGKGRVRNGEGEYEGMIKRETEVKERKGEGDKLGGK